MAVLGEMFPRKRIQEDADAAQGGEGWTLGPIDLERGVVTLQASDTGAEPREESDHPGLGGAGPADSPEPRS